jgi:hypothetical protein
MPLALERNQSKPVVIIECEMSPLGTSLAKIRTVMHFANVTHDGILLIIHQTSGVIYS